ncbi:hypothetical protein J4032_17720 [Streptomyces formicae]|uniref:UvrABC system protein A n=1 Tax=Streptomyces formicae TaxID=1616117 RepID=A0ABY3WZB4_9ACTN|nr:hypothetical protein J4032_17720 [Streptomyces formicae]
MYASVAVPTVERELALSLKEGAITAPNFAVDSWYWQVLAGSGFYDPDKKLKDFTDQEWHDFLHKESCNTVIVIEHHQTVMAHADLLIDLGPGGGHDGGRVVFTGTPADLIVGGDTLTARHLGEYVTSQGVSGPRGHGRGGARRRAWRR